jgi:hypothetical protein
VRGYYSGPRQCSLAQVVYILWILYQSLH